MIKEIRTDHRAKTAKYMLYLKKTQNISNKKFMQNEAFDYLHKYLQNPVLITINLNNGISSETHIIEFVRKIFQKYYRFIYKKKWFQNPNKQKFAFCIEHATHTHIHLLVDNCGMAEYLLLQEFTKIQELKDNKNITIKYMDFEFKLTPEQYQEKIDPNAIADELTKNGYKKLFGVNISEDYMNKFDGMTDQEKEIHVNDTLNISRPLYYNEKKAEKLMKQTKVKVFNYAMEFLKIIENKTNRPTNSISYKNKSKLTNELKEVYQYMTALNNGIKTNKPNIPSILSLARSKYNEWGELIKTSADKPQINQCRQWRRDLAWELNKLGSDILSVENSEVNISKRKRKLVDFPMIIKMTQEGIEHWNNKYEELLGLNTTLRELENWFLEQFDVPSIKAIIDKVNSYKEADLILADDDIKSWLDEVKQLNFLEKTKTDKNAAIGYVVKTCCDSYADNNFPIYTDQTIFYPSKNDK